LEFSSSPRNQNTFRLHLHLRAPAYSLAALLLPFLVPAASTALAGSATWNLNPTSNDWNTAAN